MNSRSTGELLALIADTGLYLVTEDAVAPETRLAAVRTALDAGARVVQLRDKRTPKARLVQEARALKAACEERGGILIINDDVALAMAAGAHGVHLGQDDLPLSDARRLVGSETLIGISISAVSEALAADRQGADYIGVGAIYATPTKTDAEYGGLELLRAVRGVTERPLVAIGGIDPTNAGEVFDAGADAVAVVRAVFGRPDVAARTRQLLELARTHKGGYR